MGGQFPRNLNRSLKSAVHAASITTNCQPFGSVGNVLVCLLGSHRFVLVRSPSRAGLEKNPVYVY